MDKKLTANDYVTETLAGLVRHPNYSSKAFDVVMRFMLLTTEELEALDDVIGGN